jgi:GNAT superfamily N-acetyltransferase
VTREERVALGAYRALAPVVEDVGGAVVMRFPEAPDVPLLNRAVGLGVERPATEDDVDSVVAAMGTGTTFYVAVAFAARPAELADWLAARGLEPGWGWMLFRRPVTSGLSASGALDVREVRDADDARAFARIVCAGYGMPEALNSAMERAALAGWLCWLALDGDEPVSAAAMYVAEGAGYLGLAATLPEHRGKGAQTALLATRIRRAAELGCDVVLTETGERRDDRPSSSYRNILRAGFEEVAVTANWLGRS